MVQKKIGLGRVVHPEEAVEIAAQLIRDGKTTEDQWTERFEKALAYYTGYRHAVAASSGTGALWMIFSQLGKRVVTTTPLTFAATVNVPESLSWPVRYADVNNEDYGLALQPSTFTLTVHLLGYPSRVSGDVADACEAVGSKLPKPNYATAVSFYPSHTIGVGELGAVLTDIRELAVLCNLAKDNGRDRRSSDITTKFRRQTLGLNFKASEVNSLLAYYQLQQVDYMVRKRQEVVKAYCDLLPPELEKGRYDQRCAYLGYPVVFESFDQKQDVMMVLEQEAVECRSLFPLLGGYSLPEASRLSECGIYIPSHSLMTDDEVHRVAAAVKKGLKA